jgi:hypothetical protein
VLHRGGGRHATSPDHHRHRVRRRRGRHRLRGPLHRRQPARHAGGRRTHTAGAQPAPKPIPLPPSAPKAPVLADGHYDAYISRVEVPYEGGTGRLVVDLVQVFDGPAARDAAIADGVTRDKAQYLGVYVRNQNPRLRTLPLAGDARLDLRGGCEAPLSHQLAALAADARAMSGPVHTYYFTLTVAGGAVHHVQEFVAINAC